uniref:Uncharacterized protein n=1 Tax=Sphaerodactylus townsendi TaxID=933632 RepID=A0ACB8FWC7_9SAUR
MDPGAPSKEVSPSSLTESKAAHGPARTGERPKKRSSDRKSRKAAERSSFAPSFFLEGEKIAGGLPAGQAKERAVSSGEAASEAANQLLEVAADPAKSDACSALPQVGQPDVSPTSRGEWTDFPSSAYPFIMETPAKTPEAGAQTEGIAAVPHQGKGFGSCSLEDSIMVEPSPIASTSNLKKRTSDGRSKKSGKPAAEPPEPSAGMNRLPKTGTATDVDAVDQGNSTPLEQPGGSRGPFPALKMVEGPEGKKDEDSIAAAGGNSCSEQLPASAHKTSPVKPEPLAKIKDASSTRRGQEVRLAALEQLAEAVSCLRVASSPRRGNQRASEENAGEPKSQLHVDFGRQEAMMKSDPGPAAACKETGQPEKGPSPTKGKGRAAGNLVRDAEATGHVSNEPLVDETIKGVPEGMTGKSSSGVNPFFPSGFEAEQALGAEIHEKPRGHPSDRRRKEGRDGSSELASRQDLSAKPAKRGSDGKSKKAVGSPEQPVLAATKPDPSRGQRPPGAELNYALEETEFVDENRNIKSFPPGHPVLWDGNTMSLFGPFGPPGPAAVEEAGSKSQCPFLKYQGKAAADLRKEQLSPPEPLRGPSGGRWADMPDLPEDSAAGEVREALIEASLLVTAGDKTRERRKKTRQAALDRVAKDNAKAEEDRALSSVFTEAGAGGVDLSDKVPSFGLSSSELAVMEEKTAALTTGAGAEGREVIVPSAELPAPWEGNKEVIALQALTTALVGGPGEPTGSSEGTEVDKQRASECPGSLGSEAGVDKASKDVPTTEAASANKPQGSSEPLEQGAANEPVVFQPALPAGQEEPTRKAAEQMNAQAPVSEAGPSVAGGLRSVAERPDRAARETKREERARPVEQIKGYMRPTKSRGLPPPPLRAAAPEPGKRRPAKADGPGPHRQERAYGSFGRGSLSPSV